MWFALVDGVMANRMQAKAYKMSKHVGLSCLVGGNYSTTM